MTTIPLETFETTAPSPDTKCLDELFERVFGIVAEYNQHMCFIEGPDTFKGREKSESVLEIVRQINGIGARAQSDIAAQVDRLKRATEDFAWQMREGELDLGNPLWAGESGLLRCSEPMNLDWQR